MERRGSFFGVVEGLSGILLRHINHVRMASFPVRQDLLHTDSVRVGPILGVAWWKVVSGDRADTQYRCCTFLWRLVRLSCGRNIVTLREEASYIMDPQDVGKE